MGHTEAAKEATLLLELAIARSRASGLADEETKARIRGALEKAKQEILRLEERSDDRAGPPGSSLVPVALRPRAG